MGIGKIALGLVALAGATWGGEVRWESNLAAAKAKALKEKKLLFIDIYADH